MTTELQTWESVVRLVSTGGASVILIGIILGFLRGAIHTGVAYEAIAKDRDEWRTAYRAIADVALRHILDDAGERR